MSEDKSQQILDFLNESLAKIGWGASFNDEPLEIIIEGNTLTVVEGE
jgi:hypothetical protein